jgi:hypothetical protein
MLAEGVYEEATGAIEVINGAFSCLLARPMCMIEKVRVKGLLVKG